MNELLEKYPPHAAVGNHVDILKKIREEDINIAIAGRSIAHLMESVNALVTKDFEYRLSGTRDELIVQLRSQPEFAGSYDLFIADLDYLLFIFSEITQSKQFRILLATINHNMCRNFHIDNNDLRLLCTYHGPGTLWVAQGSEDQAPSVTIPKESIRSTEPGEIVILKGARLHGNEKAIIHRSPTIEESGLKRLLFRIDNS